MKTLVKGVDDHVRLSEAQLAFGLHMAKKIDRVGAAVVLSHDVYTYFGESVDALKWLCENNLWSVAVDEVLDVITFTDDFSNIPKPLPIQLLMKKVRKMEKRGVKEFLIPCE